MKALRLLAAVILIAGACLSGRALYLHAKAELAGILIRRAWEKSLQTGTPHAPWAWADTHPIARLRIPRLGYDEFVLEGATPRTLAFGPARLMSGARMGEAGNLVLAGHRTSWFRSLEGIGAGDSIQMDWFDARGALAKLYGEHDSGDRAAGRCVARANGGGFADADHVLSVWAQPEVAAKVCGSSGAGGSGEDLRWRIDSCIRAGGRFKSEPRTLKRADL
jgi:sortase A